MSESVHGVAGGAANRTKHCADMFLGVGQAAWGEGVGWKLMQTLLAWTVDTPLRRLSLTSATDNCRAVALYKKTGFVIEGVKKGSILLGEQLIDEYSMSMLLAPRREDS